MRNVVLLLFVFVAAGCSSSPTESTLAPMPDWVRQPTRIVDNGYIVYVGSGEDSSRERAQFKAESAALQDLANECSFVPKGARLEDRYEKTENRLHEAYAKVGVEFQLCEEAKRALQPDQVKKLANETMTEQIRKYQDMLGDMPDAETVANLDDTEAIPGMKDDPAKQATTVSGSPNNTFRFFLIRQQVALEKQRVILAPAPVYASATPASARYLSAVTAASARAEQFQAAHPEIKQTTQTWSGQQQRVREIVRQRDPRYQHTLQKGAASGNAPGGKPHRRGPGGRGGRHRRGGFAGGGTPPG